MKISQDAAERERQMILDLWEFRKTYWGPEEAPGYWEDVVRTVDELSRKHDDPYMDGLLYATVADLERRNGRNVALICLDNGARSPFNATRGSAGYDLYCANDVVIMPDQTETVHTGVHIRCPFGTTGLLFMRSGAAKRGLRLVTGVSVIDEDYTGEITAGIANIGDEVIHIHAGERIMQLVFPFIVKPDMKIVDALPHTGRGDGGFGSTGR